MIEGVVDDARVTDPAMTNVTATSLSRTGGVLVNDCFSIQKIESNLDRTAIYRIVSLSIDLLMLEFTSL